MKTKFFLIVFVLMSVHGMASAQVKDAIDRAQRQAQRELEKNMPKVKYYLQPQKPQYDTATNRAIRFAVETKEWERRMQESQNLGKRIQESLPIIPGKFPKEKDFFGWRPRIGITPFLEDFKFDSKKPNYITKTAIARLFNEFAIKNKISEKITRRDFLFIAVRMRLSEILMQDSLYSPKDRDIMRMVPVSGFGWSNICVVKIPANIDGAPSVMFMAHTDVDSVSSEKSYAKTIPIHYNNKGKAVKLENGSTISRMDTSENGVIDPYNGRSITMFCTNGETPISVEGVCSSTILVDLCAQVAFNDTIKHGDVYFCLFKDKRYLYQPKVITYLDTLIMGGADSNVMVYLNGARFGSYACNNVNLAPISTLMDKALSGSKIKWTATNLKEAWNKLPISIVHLYCGMHNPGTLKEWACLEDMMDAIRLGRDIVANIRKMK